MTSAETRTWKPAHYLAVAGGVLLFWQGWTVVAWLADGPRQVTEFRDTGSVSWWTCRVYEVLAMVLTLGMGTWVVRQCRRERRFTFEAKVCVAGALSYWLNPGLNFVQPLWMWSSNFVNVENWLGHTPFVINPDAGRMPEPWLFALPVYTFGILGFVMILCGVMRRAQERWPSISTARVVTIAFAVGALCDLATEVPPFLLGAWKYPGSPDELAIFGHSSSKYHLVEILMVAMEYAVWASIRYYRDDHGHTIVERGLEGLRPRRQAVVSTVALVGIFNLGLIAGNSGNTVVGFFSDPYRRMPAHIVNGLCNTPGVTGTRYGPCPGSPGFRMPVRSLPGPRP